MSGRTARPRRRQPDELVDAALLAAALMLALSGFSTTFDSRRYLLVGLVGVVIGIGLAHLVRSRHRPWLVTLILALVAYVLLGSVLALPDKLVGGWLPSLAAVRQASELAVYGWKTLLTSRPPVDGAGPLVVLPYLMALLTAAAGHEVARRSRRNLPVLFAPLVLFAAVVLLGTVDLTRLGWRGIALAALLVGWPVARAGRGHGRVVAVSGPGRPFLLQALTAAVLVGAAVAGAVTLGGQVPTLAATRLVLRSYVQPPFNVQQLVSPLTSFRRFTAGSQDLYHQDLLQVSGVTKGSLLRFAVLDDYDGAVWTASPVTSGDRERGAFPRVGSRVEGRSGAGEPTLTLTVQKAYADDPDLSAWLPGVGAASRITFAGAHADSHATFLRYNSGTDQAVLPDLLRAGDVVTERSAVLPTDDGPDPEPYPQVDLDAQFYGFVGPAAERWSGSSAAAWDQLMSVAQVFRQGSWSDGTRPDEGFYLPGHGMGRLQVFLSGSKLPIGSDEHYAAALALVANDLGIPARVVLGAVVPGGGMVQGSDVHAWVEARLADGHWVAIAPDVFIPPRNRHPPRPKRRRATDSPAAVVPPPAATKPPGDLDNLLSTTPTVSAAKPPPPSLLDRVPHRVWVVLAAVGIPLGVIGAYVGLVLGLKLLRRRRRRTRGSPTARIAEGWREVLDRARDLGHRVRIGATRREQALGLDAPALGPLAAAADAATFGGGLTPSVSPEVYWTDVERASAALASSASKRRRLGAAVSPASLLSRH